MRILHVIAGAAVGGAETFAVDAITALADRGVVQQVVCRPFPDVLQRYAAAGVATTPFMFSAIDRVLHRDVVAREVLRFEPDLVHAWMSRAGAFTPSGLPCPAIGWFGDAYKLKYFRGCDSFFAVTPDIAAGIVRGGMPPERVFTTNTFGTMPYAAAVDRSTLGVPDGAPVALVLSRMHHVKGIDTLLQAAVELPGLHLWLAGDGPERSNYEALATRLGLRHRAHFLGWRTDRKALLEACDICVLPSRYEPFGTVIVEAWGAGRPLIATAADGARQYVHDGEDGLVCPIEDPAALAACLSRVLHEDGLAPRLVAAGRRKFQQDFTRKIVIDRLLDAYSAVLKLGKRSSTS